MPMPITKYFTSCTDPYAEFFKICTPVSRKVMHACQLYHEVTLVASYTFIVACKSTNSRLVPGLRGKQELHWKGHASCRNYIILLRRHHKFC